jgi:PPP family 3-phenylpropionic acid transporter
MSAQAPLTAAPAARVTLVMSALFAAAGVILVFLPRWLEAERGLSGEQIGAVLSLAQLARIGTGPLIAFWADGLADRNAALRFGSATALVAYAVFFFLPQDFWSLLITGFVALSLTQGLTPLVEGAVLRATARGPINYGMARGIGSVAFIIANVAGGALVARFGLAAVVAWVLCSLALLVASSWLGLTHERAQPPPRTARAGAVRDLLRNRRFLILIVACGLIQSGHAFYYGFSTIVWRSQGIASDVIGVLWAFGVAVEVALLWSLAPIERRVSPEALILIGAVGGVLRWCAMGFAPDGWVLWPLQALHALSFAAAHVGAMRLLFREAPENAAAMAQTLYSALSAGLLMGAATLASGRLYDWIGAQGYWAMAVLVAAGGLLALFLLVPHPARSR